MTIGGELSELKRRMDQLEEEFCKTISALSTYVDAHQKRLQNLEFDMVHLKTRVEALELRNKKIGMP